MVLIRLCQITMSVLFVTSTGSWAASAVSTASAAIQNASGSSSNDTVTVSTDADGDASVTTTTAVVGNTTSVTVSTNSSTGINSLSATTTVVGDTSGNSLVSVALEPSSGNDTDIDNTPAPVTYHNTNNQDTPSNEIIAAVKTDIKQALQQSDKRLAHHDAHNNATTQRNILNTINNILNGNLANSEVSITPYQFTIPTGQTAIIKLKHNTNAILIGRKGGQMNTIHCSGTCSLNLISVKDGNQTPPQLIIDHR